MHAPLSVYFCTAHISKTQFRIKDHISISKHLKKSFHIRPHVASSVLYGHAVCLSLSQMCLHEKEQGFEQSEPQEPASASLCLSSNV